MKRIISRIAIFLGMLILISLTIVIVVTKKNQNKICINEVNNNNITFYKADDGTYTDYIELYNYGKHTANLKGYSVVVDDKSFNLGNVNIKAQSYIIISFSEKNICDEDGLKADFGLADSDIVVELINGDGKKIDSIDISQTKYNTSYGRAEDGKNEWINMEGTPGKTNEGAKKITSEVQAPEISINSGFYDDSIDVELLSENNEIFYTTDGSIPTTSSTRYSGSVHIEDLSGEKNQYRNTQNIIKNYNSYSPEQYLYETGDKATVLMAIAVDENGNASEVSSAVYFIDYKDKEQYNNMQIISIVGNPDEIFGDDGIYVTGKEYDEWYLDGKIGDEPVPNFANTDGKYEAAVNIELFDNNHELILNQIAGMKINNNSACNLINKDLFLFSRAEYNGLEFFSSQILNGKRTQTIKLSNNMNYVIHKLVEGKNVAIQDAEQVCVFINGEYWNTTFISESFDDIYFQETYGVNADDVVLIANGNTVAIGEPDDIKLYNTFVNSITKKDMTIESNYEEACTMMDMDSYIQFICTNLLNCNIGISETNNYRLWRTRNSSDNEFGDGKWRWCIYNDNCFEEALAQYEYMKKNNRLDEFVIQYDIQNGNYFSLPLLSSLLKNNNFRERFVSVLNDMLNTSFSAENIANVADEYGISQDYIDFIEFRVRYIKDYVKNEL